VARCVLAKAVHVDPTKRYDELSEFTYDLRHPSARYLSKTRRRSSNEGR